MEPLQTLLEQLYMKDSEPPGPPPASALLAPQQLYPPRAEANPNIPPGDHGTVPPVLWGGGHLYFHCQGRSLGMGDFLTPVKDRPFFFGCEIFFKKKNNKIDC